MTSTHQCPKWAVGLIRQMAALEIKLGHITNENNWLGGDLDELIARTAADFGTTDEAAVEALFRKICRGLVGEGFEAGAIAGFINARVAVRMKLPYCDANEVRDALD